MKSIYIYLRVVLVTLHDDLLHAPLYSPTFAFVTSWFLSRWFTLFLGLRTEVLYIPSNRALRGTHELDWIKSVGLFCGVFVAFAERKVVKVIIIIPSIAVDVAVVVVVAVEEVVRRRGDRTPLGTKHAPTSMDVDMDVNMLRLAARACVCVCVPRQAQQA